MFNNLIPSVILSVIQRVSVIQSAAKNLFPLCALREWILRCALNDRENKPLESLT